MRARQLRAVVASQTSTILVVATVIGVPLGVAAGRWAWTSLRHEIGVVPAPVGPAALALGVPAHRSGAPAATWPAAKPAGFGCPPPAVGVPRASAPAARPVAHRARPATIGPRERSCIPAVPARLHLGRRHSRLPDRGRGSGGRPRRVGLGHVLPSARRDPGRPDRRRRRRPLPPLARRRRTDGRARHRHLPVLGRLAADPAARLGRRSMPRASTSTTGSPTACSPAASRRCPRCITGTCPSRWRTPAAGWRGTRPTGSPSTRA